MNKMRVNVTPSFRIVRFFFCFTSSPCTKCLLFCNRDSQITIFLSNAVLPHVRSFIVPFFLLFPSIKILHFLTQRITLTYENLLRNYVIFVFMLQYRNHINYIFQYYFLFSHFFFLILYYKPFSDFI